MRSVFKNILAAPGDPGALPPHKTPAKDVKVPQPTQVWPQSGAGLSCMILDPLEGKNHNRLVLALLLQCENKRDPQVIPSAEGNAPHPGNAFLQPNPDSDRALGSVSQTYLAECIKQLHTCRNLQQQLKGVVTFGWNTSSTQWRSRGS